MRSQRASSAQLQVMYPGIARGAVASRGVYIGRDCHGGSFCYDPWELYSAGALTGPNMLVIGQIGRGKSAVVKSYVLRQLVFGRQAIMLDPKGENGPLCAAAGVAPVVLRPGGDVRLNPLEAMGRVRDPELCLQQRVSIVAAVVGATVGRGLSAEELVACEGAIAAATVARQPITPTLRDVVAQLLEPGERAAARAHCTQEQLAERSRTIALTLRRLVDGDLRGMFDESTSAAISLDAPLVSFDLSALYRSPALGVLMTCVAAWLQSVVAADDRRRIVVIDEAWAVLRNAETARWLQAGYKLARAEGVQYIAVLHRLSDLLAAGDQGSQQAQLARGLLADSETVVVYAQPAAELEATAELLELNDVERRCIEALPRGYALWRLGQRPFLVEHRLGALERAAVDTDSRMASTPGRA